MNHPGAPASPHARHIVDDALRARRSIRAFTAQPLPRVLVEDILDVAARAPSNSNIQPWHVHAIAGEPLARLSAALVDAFGQVPLPPSPHFPDPLPEIFVRRQREFGAVLYDTLAIDVDDRAGRRAHTEKNFRFFGAPAALFFTIDRRLAPHSWLDLGMLVQNVMIAACARGLGTCPQASFARFHAVIARHLTLTEHEQTVCGMSLGYPDLQAPVNRMAMPRRPVREFANFDHFDHFAEADR